MTATPWARRLAWVLCLVWAGLSAGCFDYELELALTKTGHGGVTVMLTLPEAVAARYGVDSATLNTLVFPIPKRERVVNGGLVAIKEENTFDNLDDLAARRVLMEVKEIGTGLAGLGGYKYRVTIRLEMAEGDLPDRQVLPGMELMERAPQAQASDPAQERARALRARGLAGHFVTIAVKFPGEVDKTYPLVLGGSKLEGFSDQNGQRAVWKVPLSVLVNENVRNTLVFIAEFKGRLTFRAYEQKDARSHYPDAFDEALGRGENLPGGRAQFYRQQQQQPQPNR